MSLETSLAAFKVALDRMFDQVARVATGKRGSTAVSQITGKVAGLTLNQLTTQIRSSMAPHIAARGNAHNDTPTSVGIHTAEEWQAVEPTLLPKNIVPVCRYGSLNYLPPGLTGSFEGGTTGKLRSSAAMMIEEDGTLVYLRNGTDGSKNGVFYAYMPNATIRATNPVKTTRRYRPSWFPAGMSARMVYASSTSVIFGQLQDANGVAGDYFMSLTNGTFDDSKHTGGIILKAVAEAFGTDGESFLAGNSVYFYGQTPISQITPLDLSVWTIPRTTLATANGGTVTPTKVTGITTKGFNNISYSGLDQIRFTGKLASAVPGDNPLALLIGTFSSAVVFYWDVPTLTSAYDPVSGLIRTRVVGQSRFVTTGNSLYNATGFSFTFNPATKQVTLDPYYLSGINTVTAAGDLPEFAGPSFDILTTDKFATTGQQKSSYTFDGNGNGARIYISTGIDNMTMMVGMMNNFTSVFDGLEGQARTISNKSTQAIRPSFGTALGSNMFAPVILSPTRMILQTDGVNKAGAFQRGYAVTTLEGNGSSYTYDSIYLGQVKGFAPSADRSFLTDLDLVPGDYSMSVTEVTASSIFASTLRFACGHPGLSTVNQTTGRKSINPDLTLGDVVTCSETVLQRLAGTISTQVVAAGGLSFDQYVVDLTIPTTNNVPPFAMVVAQDSAMNTIFVIAKVNITRDAAGNVTNATANKTYPVRIVYAGTSRGLGFSTANMTYCGSMAMFDDGADVMIGCSSVANMLIPGGNPIPTVAFRFNKASNDFVVTAGYNMRTWNHFSNQSGRGFVAYPTLGFGMYWGTIGETGYSDETTKLNFLPVAKTAAEFDVWTSGTVGPTSEWTCLASQKAAEGWVLYFSEETPLVLNGNYYVLPVSSVDLRTIVANAANRTFYIYARIVSNVAQYVVATSQSSESNANMLIGKVFTNATQIATIEAEKVTRLGNFRISTTAKGSAIPVSTGLPRLSDKLQWS